MISPFQLELANIGNNISQIVTFQTFYLPNDAIHIGPTKILPASDCCIAQHGDWCFNILKTQQLKCDLLPTGVEAKRLANYQLKS